ncbi:MAG: hypothetical protein JKY56_18240, partial [Kofleriaceae bacterium]|nr:hypothetical protein [Kofleriaceae bacterium]
AYQFTICRIDAIALGGVAAMLFRDLNIVSLFAHKRTLIRITLVVAAVLTFIVTKGAPRIGLLSQTIGYSLWAIIAAIWVYDVATSDPRGKLVRALSWQPLRKVGAYSYAMYVFHKPLHQLVGHPFVDGYYQAGAVSPLFNLLYFIALSGLVFFLAHVSFHVFEKQFLPLKRYFVASHKSK